MKPAAQRYETQPRPSRSAQYQLEMGTKSLLAAFFALAVICGLFFAFGYTIGKHAIPATFTLGGAQALPPRHISTPARLAATPAASPATGGSTAGNGIAPPNPVQLGAAENGTTPASLSPAANANAASASAANAGAQAAPAAAKPAPSTAPPTPVSGAKSPAAPPQLPTAKPALPAAQAAAPASNSASSQLYEVQVFAGTQDDAGSLTNALKARGYPAEVEPPPAASGSNLYRVEVGPYLTRAEAEAMRSRLRADGYQAVLRFGTQN